MIRTVLFHLVRGESGHCAVGAFLLGTVKTQLLLVIDIVGEGHVLRVCVVRRCQTVSATTHQLRRGMTHYWLGPC